MLDVIGTAGRCQGDLGAHHPAGPGPAVRLPGSARLPVRMPLDGPLLPADWTAEINYLANSDGSMTLSLADGDEVKVPVRPG